MAKKGMKHYYPKHEKKQGPPISEKNKIPEAFPAIDNDMAVENINNDFDMTFADLQDLQ